MSDTSGRAGVYKLPVSGEAAPASGAGDAKGAALPQRSWQGLCGSRRWFPGRKRRGQSPSPSPAQALTQSGYEPFHHSIPPRSIHQFYECCLGLHCVSDTQAGENDKSLVVTHPLCHGLKPGCSAPEATLTCEQGS